jgi:hypothetical protein
MFFKAFALGRLGYKVRLRKFARFRCLGVHLRRLGTRLGVKAGVECLTALKTRVKITLYIRSPTAAVGFMERKNKQVHSHCNVKFCWLKTP